jgi:predicted GIY-YIG superfamily endonuclease
MLPEYAKPGSHIGTILIVSNYALASQRNELKDFTYVYSLLSRKDATHRYIGLTDNLEARLKSHNRGDNPHTAKYKPWRIKTAIAFTDRQKALDFESYIISPSGRAYAKKRL